jgi:hypothetical protein
MPSTKKQSSDNGTFETNSGNDSVHHIKHHNNNNNNNQRVKTQQQHQQQQQETIITVAKSSATAGTDKNHASRKYDHSHNDESDDDDDDDDDNDDVYEIVQPDHQIRTNRWKPLPSDKDEALRVAQKREMNRRHAFKSRQRHKGKVLI